MSYLGDDVQTLPWSRCRSLCDSQTEPADKTVVTEVPWFLEQELAALDPNNRPKVEPTTDPAANSLLLTFTVGSDPADPDNNSAAVVPLRAGSFRVPSARVKTRRGLWTRARTRLLGLVCVVWALVVRTLVLHRAGG